MHARLTAGGLRTLAITGSSGKTSTKDLLGQVLAAAGPTVSPPGSFNNEIGLPLTVLGADADTRYLVLEMGARGRRPHRPPLRRSPARRSASCSTSARAHLGEFGSRRGHRRRPRASSSRRCPTTAPPCSTPTTPACSAWPRAPRPASSPPAPGADADVRATDVALDDAGPRAASPWSPRGEEHPVALQVVGEHQVANALSAAGRRAGRRPGARPTSPRRCRAAGPRSRWRMEVAERADGVTVVNDAYNANPESMRAALAALAGLAGRAADRRARRHGRARRRRAPPSTSGSAATRSPPGWTWSWPSGPMPVGIADGAVRCRASRGEESVHVPDRAAARRAAVGACCAPGTSSW